MNALPLDRYCIIIIIEYILIEYLLKEGLMRRSAAKQATREKLLEIAESILIRSNFKASTALIAKNANIAHGTIFFHFKDRDDLLLAVVRRLVLRLTTSLYTTYRDCENLEAFLAQYFKTVQKEEPIFKALFSGFSDFTDDTKQEVMCLLSVINYYLFEAFHKWSDHAIIQTMLWQGVLMYMTFFGEHMFDSEKISETYAGALISFLCGTVVSEKKRKREEIREKKRLCMSCGMLLGHPEDSPKGDTSQDYCKRCAGENGALRPFDEVFDTMTDLLKKVQALNADAARQAAFAILSKNPAWKEYIKKYY
jgi:AcrR family transcriptional regulator